MKEDKQQMDKPDYTIQIKFNPETDKWMAEITVNYRYSDGINLVQIDIPNLMREAGLWIEEH